MSLRIVIGYATDKPNSEPTLVYLGRSGADADTARAASTCARFEIYNNPVGIRKNNPHAARNRAALDPERQAIVARLQEAARLEAEGRARALREEARLKAEAAIKAEGITQAAIDAVLKILDDALAASSSPLETAHSALVEAANLGPSDVPQSAEPSSPQDAPDSSPSAPRENATPASPAAGEVATPAGETPETEDHFAGDPTPKRARKKPASSASPH